MRRMGDMRMEDAKVGMTVRTNHGNLATIVFLCAQYPHIVHWPRPRRYVADYRNIEPVEQPSPEQIFEATIKAFVP